MNTWETLITDEMDMQNETWDHVESCTLTQDELRAEFDDDYGAANGKPFTLWTHNRVYFPVVYDGSEWVASVPRHPNGQPTSHVGGQ